MEYNLSGLKRSFILFNVLLSTFMATLDGSIVNIALPVISDRLHENISSIQWVVTSYLLAISILLPIWGKISDLYGKKYIFAAGFIIFTIGSILCGLSPNLLMLVLSRVLQAVGASAMMALSQGIVTSIYPPGERGRALGITGTTVAIGSLAGPSLGGVLVHAFGWQSIFFVNAPIGIFGTILTFVLLPHMHEVQEEKKFDYKGAGLFAIGTLLLFISILFLQDGVIPLQLFVPMFAASLILIILLVIFEKRAEFPLIDINLFKIRIFSFGISSAFLSFVAMNSTLLFVPFYLQSVLKLDTMRAGLVIFFFPVTTAIVAPISGWLSDRISYRALTVTGLSISTAVLIRFSMLNATTSLVEVSVLMALMGLGSAIFQSPNNNGVMSSVPRNRLGVAGGMNALFRNLGMVTGTTLSVLIFTYSTNININNLSGGNAESDIFLSGLRIVLLFAAGCYFAAVLVSLVRAVGSRKSVQT